MSALIVNNESVSIQEPLTCAVCFETFKRKDNMRRHMNRKNHIFFNVNDTFPDNLEITLPKNWNYGAYKLDTNNSSLTFFIYDLHTKEDVIRWMKLYMEQNQSRFACVQTRSLKAAKQFRYQCEHRKDCNRDHKKKKVKGTGCKCAILFNLKRGSANIEISHLHHNHSLTSAAVTSFHRPKEDVKQIFLQMFEHGTRPSEALNQYKNLIRNQLINDAEYFKFCADRSQMPDYKWVHHLYKTQLKEKYSSTRIHDVIESERCVDDFSDPLPSVLNVETKLELYYPVVDIKSASEDFFAPLHSIECNTEELVIESTEDHCEETQKSNDKTLELNQEGEHEIKKFLKNCEKLGQIMLENPAMYISGLKSFNKHATDMISMQSQILPSLFSFNKNNDLLMEMEMCST